MILESVDGDRLLVDRDSSTLDVLTSKGALVSRLRRAHGGGAAMRGGRIASISGRTLRAGTTTCRVAAGARLEDVEGDLAVYSVETQLHLVRMSDGRDVRLRLPGQFGYVHARLWNGALFYAYNQRTGRLGHAGYVDAARVRALLHG